MNFALNSICVHSQVPKEFSRPGPSLVDDDPPPLTPCRLHRGHSIRIIMMMLMLHIKGKGQGQLQPIEDSWYHTRAAAGACSNMLSGLNHRCLD